MLHLLRGKGYKELEKVRPRGLNENPEEYQKYLEAVLTFGEHGKSNMLSLIHI